MKPRALALLLFLTLTAAAQEPLIGVLEAFASGTFYTRNPPGVRVLFYQSGHLWHSYNTTCQDKACLKTITLVFPRTTTWNLIEDGKPAASVIATTPPAYRSESEIGVQVITSPAVADLELLQVLSPHIIFATTLKPLPDPDNWHPVSASPLDLTLVREAFRKLYPQLKNCQRLASDPPLNDHDSIPSDEELELGDSYVSNKNWRILQITALGFFCLGASEDAFGDQLFAISPTGQIQHLGQNMDFVGVGDFANDGRSEILFKVKGRWGYSLFYDNFSQQVLTPVALP
jgi:hypothetical protein